MTHEAAPRPRRAIEDTDEFFSPSGASWPGLGSRFVKGGIAFSAVAAVCVLTLAAPGLAQAAGRSSQSGSPTPTTTAAAGTVESFAVRGSSTDRDAVREGLSDESVADAVGARSETLSNQAQTVAASQQQAALVTRASGLDTTATQIRAESDRLLSLTFFKPTDGGITSEWGMRLHPILRYTRMHAGVDMGGACGQPIWAARDGVVAGVSSGSQSGNQVRLDHGSDTGEHVETAYLHMQSIQVKVGQTVKRGERIGTVGNTGLSTACHLHFAVYANGDNVNPRTYLG